MLNLEDFMNIRDLKQKGWSVSAIAGELHLDRKTVRKHLLDAPQPYKRENPAACKIDPHRPFLHEIMLILPRHIQALACCAGACLQSSFCTWGIFNRHKWGIFNRRFWGIFNR